MADAPVAPALQEAPPAAAPTPLGRRAKLTQDALFVASNKVIKVLDDKAMRQCFPPDWDQQYPDLIPGLREMVVATYKEGIPLAWNDLAQSADFVEKANQLDRLLEEAKQRQARAEPPRNAYEIGLDATVTTPSATTPRVQNAISLLRQKRLALAEQNQSTYERIATLSRTVASVERQNDEILKHFTQEKPHFLRQQTENRASLPSEKSTTTRPLPRCRTSSSRLSDRLSLPRPSQVRHHGLTCRIQTPFQSRGRRTLLC